jgi:hypothetical protein
MTPAKETVPVFKDDEQHPIADEWRPTLREVVKALVRKDYGLSSGVAGVGPVAPKTARQIREYVEEYGETLVELTEETWDTSVSHWYESQNEWELLVDLRTVAEGRSDLALHCKVRETDEGYIFIVGLVYVP